MYIYIFNKIDYKEGIYLELFKEKISSIIGENHFYVNKNHTIYYKKLLFS